MSIASWMIKVLAGGCILSVPYTILIVLSFNGAGDLFYPLLGVALLFGLPWSLPIVLLSIYLSDSMNVTSPFFHALVPGKNEWDGILGALVFSGFCSLHINGCWIYSRQAKRTAKELST
ncbi:MAG: hypothetical protein ABIK82_10055 [Pseudomonadota bacterium]